MLYWVCIFSLSNTSFIDFMTDCSLLLNTSYTLNPIFLLNSSTLSALRIFTNFSAKSLSINLLNSWYFRSSTNSNLRFLYSGSYLFLTKIFKFECPIPVSIYYSFWQKYLLLAWTSWITSIPLFFHAILLMIVIFVCIEKYICF